MTELALAPRRSLPPWQALGLSLALHALAVLPLLAWLGSRPAAPGREPLQVALLRPGPDAAAAPAPVRAKAVLPARRAASPAAIVAVSPHDPAPAPILPPSPVPSPGPTLSAAPGPATPAAMPTPSSLASSAVPAPVDFIPASANAAYLDNPAPVYPSLARQQGLEGLVLLQVVVSATGTPLSVSVADSSRHGLLDEAAQRAVRSWRFVPARRHGEAVEDTVRVPVRFSLGAG